MLDLRTLLLATCAFALVSGNASAEEPPPPRGSLGVAMTVSNEAYGLDLDARYRMPRGTMLGVALSLDGVSTAYFGGRTVHGAYSVEPTALALVPLVRQGALALDLRVSSGARYTRDVGEPAAQYDHAVRWVTELGLFAHVRLGSRFLLRAGALCVVELEVSPTVALADQMQLLSLGAGYAVTPGALLYATAEAGGTYGFDGNNGKVVARGALGVRIPFGGDARAPF